MKNMKKFVGLSLAALMAVSMTANTALNGMRFIRAVAK